MNQPATQTIQLKYMRFLRYILMALAIFVTALMSPFVVAQKSPDSTDTVIQIESQLNELEKMAAGAANDEHRLDELNKSAVTTLKHLQNEKENIAQKLSGVTAQLDSLGETVKNEPVQVTQSRRELGIEKTQLMRALSHYRLLSLKAEELQRNIEKSQRFLVKQRLFSRGPDAISLFGYTLRDEENSLELIIKSTVSNTGFGELLQNGAAWFALVLLIITGVCIWLRTTILEWCNGISWTKELTGRFLSALIVTTARYLPYLATSLAFSVYAYINFAFNKPLPFIANVFYGLTVFIFMLYLNELLFKPKTAGHLFEKINEQQAALIAHRLQLFSIFALIGYLFVSIMYNHSQSSQALLLSRDIYASIMVLLLIWIIAAFHAISTKNSSRRIRLILFVVLAFSLITDLIGYRNLAMTVFRIFMSISLSYIVFLLIYKILNEVFLALDEGTRSWHRPIRSALGLKPKQHIPGLASMRVLVNLSVWLVFIYVVAHLLGYSDLLSRYLHNLIADGFNVGTLNINPARIFLALILFATLLTMTSWFKAKLDKKWLSATKFEKGVKDALITGSGYVGIILAVIVALGVAGFTFTNLAIIAGALSVGIGFGLQNIVNNFVSGLILLFERPIKKGDWIIVGNTEGYVKNISIRSTQIQTFDRADVIVPNSDLISNQVTNWMLRDMSGRIRVPVGVAYGSDTDKVKQILTDIALAQDFVIKDDPDRKIRVMFLNFGDSSLNFELRCHIKDVDKSMLARSDINFAIDKAFRENNIEIPFPQRDLHFKNLPANSAPPGTHGGTDKQ